MPASFTRRHLALPSNTRSASAPNNSKGRSPPACSAGIIERSEVVPWSVASCPCCSRLRCCCRRRLPLCSLPSMPRTARPSRSKPNLIRTLRSLPNPTIRQRQPLPAILRRATSQASRSSRAPTSTSATTEFSLAVSRRSSTAAAASTPQAIGQTTPRSSRSKHRRCRTAASTSASSSRPARSRIPQQSTCFATTVRHGP